MSKTLKATREAVKIAKAYGGIPMVVDIIKGAALADAIQNTLTLVWIFASRSSLIVAKVEFVKYWMILAICIPAAYIFSRQIAKALIALEIHEGLFSKWLGFVAAMVTFLLSFGGLADGMFQNVTSFWHYLEPQNAMKLLTITVVSIAPISSIKIGIVILRHLVADDLNEINESEVDLVKEELSDLQAEETLKYKSQKKKALSKGKTAKATALPSEPKGTKTLEQMRKELNLN